MTYDVSESESEDEDVVPKSICSPAARKAICGPALIQTSSVTTSQDQEHLLAIEADPHRDKVFRIATELLTTERSYVAILHLIDQVIMHGVYLSHLSTVLLDVFVTDVQRVIFYGEVIMCQIQICCRRSIFFDTGWRCLVFKCYQAKCLCSVLKKVGCICY